MQALQEMEGEGERATGEENKLLFPTCSAACGSETLFVAWAPQHPLLFGVKINEANVSPSRGKWDFEADGPG